MIGEERLVPPYCAHDELGGGGAPPAAATALGPMAVNG